MNYPLQRSDFRRPLHPSSPRGEVADRRQVDGGIRAICTLLLLFTTLSACAHIDSEEQQESVIVVPSSATTEPEYLGDGSIPDSRLVVRMSDGERDWEYELPSDQGYELSIPLRDQRDDVRADHHPLTRADQELLDHLRRTDPDFEREGIYVDDEHLLDDEDRPAADPDAPSEADPAPTRPSYLRGIDEVQRLYEAGHYEQAMIQLSDLESAYPNDERIMSMKGTLWLELGREDLARDNWEQVLQINPDNEPVQQALRRLEGDIDEHELGEDEQIEQFEDDQPE